MTEIIIIVALVALAIAWAVTRIPEAITHHYEEMIPCVTHVLHLAAGAAAFCGERAQYEAAGWHLGGPGGGARGAASGRP